MIEMLSNWSFERQTERSRGWGTIWQQRRTELNTGREVNGEGNGTPLQYFAWKIPWMEEPGRLQSTGSLRVGHDWATSLSLFTFMHWRRKWQPTPVFLPGESQGRGSLVVAVCGITQSWTWLKWLSSSSLCYSSIRTMIILVLCNMYSLASSTLVEVRGYSLGKW